MASRREEQLKLKRIARDQSAFNSVFGTNPGQVSTSKKDAHNTIPGMRHGGFAATMRQANTDFGSGYQGLDDDGANIPALIGVGIGARMLMASSSKDLWMNPALSPADYARQFTDFKYKPGDVLWSRNVLYDEPFHAAIIGDDRAVYEAYAIEGGKAKIHKRSVKDYVAHQIKLHGGEGVEYPLYGVSRAKGMDVQTGTRVGRVARKVHEMYSSGHFNPEYNMKANQGLSKINCLSLASEAHKLVGQSGFFPEEAGIKIPLSSKKMPLPTYALPWNVDLAGHNWLTKGPTKIPPGSRLGKFAGAFGALGLGFGIANADTELMGYGAGMMGLSFAAPWLSRSKLAQALPTAGILLPAALKKPFRRHLPGIGYSALALPLVGALSNEVSDLDIGSGINIAAGGALGYLGYQGYDSITGPAKMFDPKSKRLLFLADYSPGGARGHQVPAEAMQEYLKKHGWKADIIPGLSDLNKLAASGKKYRAFVDAGYNAQWVSGMPGVAVQWDVQAQRETSKGIFRTHLRPRMGLPSEGMAYIVPSAQKAAEYTKATGLENFYAMKGFTIKPEQVERIEKVKAQLQAGTLDLPGIKSGEKFVTISGGGKGFGVPEAVDILQKTKWLEETNTKAVIFSANLKEFRQKEYSVLQELVKKHPGRFSLLDMSVGGEGLRLPEYMAAAELNIFAPGASTTAEAVATGKPFIGYYGPQGSPLKSLGSYMPAFSHFVENPRFAREQYGSIASSMYLPPRELTRAQSILGKFSSSSAKVMAEAPQAAVTEMRSLLESSMLEANRGTNRVASRADFDVGKRLIDIIESAEKSGHMTPTKFRPSVQGLLLPLYASGAFKKAAMIGGGILGALGIAKYFADDIPKPLPQENQAAERIEGMHTGGIGDKMRRIWTSWGSPRDRMKTIARSIGLELDDVLSAKAFHDALAGGTVKRELGAGAFGRAELMETTFGGATLRYVKKTVRPRSELEAWARHQEARRIAKGGTGDLYAETMITALKNANLQSEAKMMRAAGDVLDIVPTPYTGTRNELYMEFMEGSSLYGAIARGQDITVPVQQIQASIKKLSAAGIVNPDPNTANILWNAKTQEVSWLDWGYAEGGMSAALKYGQNSEKFMLQQFSQLLGSARENVIRRSMTVARKGNELETASAVADANVQRISDVTPLVPHLPSTNERSARKLVQAGMQRSTTAHMWENSRSAGKRHRNSYARRIRRSRNPFDLD